MSSRYPATRAGTVSKTQYALFNPAGPAPDGTLLVTSTVYTDVNHFEIEESNTYTAIVVTWTFISVLNANVCVPPIPAIAINGNTTKLKANTFSLVTQDQSDSLTVTWAVPLIVLPFGDTPGDPPPSATTSVDVEVEITQTGDQRIVMET